MTVTSQTRLWMVLGALAVAQTAVLGFMVWQRSTLLASGREIVIDIIPVDPRSLFRGDYVILGYPISTATVPQSKKLQVNDNVFVTIAPKTSTDWQVMSVDREQPAGTQPGQIVMMARVQHAWDHVPQGDIDIRLTYGIESYFITEGTGHALEEKVREKKMQAIVSVDQTGKAGLKGLMIDGLRVVDPPLF